MIGGNLEEKCYKKRGDLLLPDKKKNGATELPLSNSGAGDVSNISSDYYSDILLKLQDEVGTKFAGKKEQSSVLASVYSFLELNKRSARVFDCGSFLEFVVTDTEKKLQQANFCRDRLCPMCNWRRSMKIFSQVSQVMNSHLMQDYQFLFLTLTVRNCSADKLSLTIQALYDGWRFLYNKCKEFRSSIEGSFRSLEVTRNKIDGTYHPHLHCVLAVKPGYFKHGYISQKRWSELWQNACDLDYCPIVHIEKIKPSSDGLAGAVAEVTKYAVKGSDYIQPDDIDLSAGIVQALLSALSGRRLCGWTGVFNDVRKVLNLDDAETGDLVHLGECDIREDVAQLIVRYHWKSGIYVRNIDG